MAEITTEIELDAERELPLLNGSLERNFRVIEEALGISMSQRGAKVMLRGEQAGVDRAAALVGEIRLLMSRGLGVSPEDLRLVLRGMAGGGAEVTLTELYGHNISVSPRKRLIVPKNRQQVEYIEAIKRHDIVVGSGPAGTGKTYLAMAMAINALLKKHVSRVILARPAVEAGERLGFLPGDLAEKVNPYLRPLYDALFDMLEVERANRLIETGVIEIAPLAFMRGRTLNDAFIILDEAQNTTTEQMKMYLTRLGYNSKTVITGDTTQIDLPLGKMSGLVVAEKLLAPIDGIKIVCFTERDVVRHRLVQAIVRAYDQYERDSEEKRENGLRRKGQNPD